MTQAVTRHRPSHLSPRVGRAHEFSPVSRWRFLRSGRTFGDWAVSVQSRGWIPPVDFVETDESYKIVAEIPGLKKDDVTLRLENQVLTLSGERRSNEADEAAGFYRSERGYGRFTRSFVLPKALLTEEIGASMEDGVLTVTVPKAPEARPQRISIH